MTAIGFRQSARLGVASIVATVTMLFSLSASAFYHVPQTAANDTAINMNGLCSLAEAMASVELGSAVNTDCVGSAGDTGIVLDGTGPYLLPGSATTSAPYMSITGNQPQATVSVIQGSSGDVLTIVSSAYLDLTQVKVQQAAGVTGRVFRNFGTLSLTKCIVQGGNTSGSGGGIYNTGSAYSDRTVVQGNKALTGSGGGIYNTNIGYLSLSKTTVMNNTALNGGGIFQEDKSVSSADLKIVQSSVNGNRALGDGGGLYLLGHGNIGTTTISKNIAGCSNELCSCTDTWCSTTNNTSASQGTGGGVHLGIGPYTGSPEIAWVTDTVAANSASQGGGVYQEATNTVEGHWSWCIIVRNTARGSSPKQHDFHGTPHSVGTGFDLNGNLFKSTTGTFGLITSGADPDYQLGTDTIISALADYGSNPNTQLWPYPRWAHKLQAGSFAIDLMPSGNGGGLDQLDQLRPNGSRTDFGSVEKY